MPAAETTEAPTGRARPDSLFRRLYASVSPIGVFGALGLALVFSIGRSINGALVSVRDGEIPAWLRETGDDFAGHALMVLVMIALIAPVMSVGPRAGWRRAVALASAIVVASLLAALIRIVQVDFENMSEIGNLPWARLFDMFLLRFSVRYGYMATLVVVVVEFYRHEVRSVAEMHDAEVDRLGLDREMASARLQVLQAQIEPHFLFNTLANVRRLYQTDPTLGTRMLDNLMGYLEVALPRMRDNISTLEREAALIEAFLNVQKIRMGRRLVFDIEIPAELRSLTVPPMMLLTLVENALKHGLSPLPEGGAVRISARRDGDQLVLAVADSGRGFGEGTSGGGTGLANIRARLAAMFGPSASMTLSTNSPRGITATLAFPASSATPTEANGT